MLFMKGVGLCLDSFFFWHVDVWFFQHHVLKRLSVLHFITFFPLSKISRLSLCGSTPGFSVMFH